MRVEINGNAKEIADLILAVQERQFQNNNIQFLVDGKEISKPSL